MNAKPLLRCSRRCALGVLVLAASLSSADRCNAQLPNADEPKIAAIAVDVGNIVTPHRQKAVFELVGVQPSQVVGITLTYPATLAGEPVSVEPLDGGRATVPAEGLRIGLDGTLTFQFQVGSAPGLYQVRLHRQSSAVALQFWALDNQHVDNSPPVLLPQ